MDIISLLFSVLVFGFSLYTYCNHDRKIKKQEVKLKELQLIKLKNENIKQNSADIRGKIEDNPNGSGRILVISNNGQASAFNLNINIKDQSEGIHIKEFQPIEKLSPKQSIESKILLQEGSNRLLKLEYTWDDNNKKKNKFEDALYFN